MLEKKVLFNFHSSTLISNNIILGDKLKCTYSCLESYFINGKFEGFIKKMYQAMNLLARKTITSESLKTMATASKEGNSLFRQSEIKLNELYRNMSDKKTQRVSVSEKVKSMCVEIDKNLEEIEEFHEKFESLNNYTKALTESHEKASKTLLQIEASKKNIEDQEALCKNCNRRFKQMENFNWSCKRHAGLWSGFNYWCCGNNRKDSQGCIVSFHTSGSSEKSETDSKSRIVCSTCREKGHTYAECSKDPNCMNPAFFKNPKLELERLSRLKKKKGKNRISSKPLEIEADNHQDDFLEIENLRELMVNGEVMENTEAKDFWPRSPQFNAIKEETFSLPPITSPRGFTSRSPHNIYSFKL